MSTATDNVKTILIVTDRYVPEVSAASTRLHSHATRWAERGHDIHVVTCVPNFPQGKVFDSYENKIFQSEKIDGVHVHRVMTYMTRNEGKWRRAVDYLSFPLVVSLLQRRLPRPDIILASSPPITVALAAQALARGLGCPWVFEVRDLWPASIRAVGVSRGRLLGWIERYELSLYRQAAAVIVLTKPFKDDIVRRGTPAEKVHVVTNGADISGFADLPAKEAARRALRLPQAAFIVGFVGTVGLSQGAATFVKAAKHLSERQDVRFVCWGEGADRRHIEAMAGNLGLKNIEFRDFVPHSQIPTVLASVDAATVLLKRDILFETVIPSKIFEIFAASRPIAACVKGEARAIIEESGGGLCADPEDDEGLAKILVRYADDPAGAERMGRSGAAFVAAHYTRDTLAQKALEIVLRAAAPRAGL